MTLHQVEELTNYWAEHPPVHISVAAYLGIGAKATTTASAPQPSISAPTQQTPDQPAARSGVMLELPPGFVHGDIHDRTLEDPIFDFAAARVREDARYSKMTNG